MLLQFSDTTSKRGIIEVIARRTGTTNATGSSYPLLDKTVDVNFALANFFVIANKAAGKRQQVDDTNHEDYPIVYADIATGVQDIFLTLDATNNQISNIYKVILTLPNGTKKFLRQVDINDEDNNFLLDSTTGIPETYELTAEGLFLHQTPNFTLEGALEVWVNRGASYFVSTDTTKQAGIPEIFQEYLVVRPSYFYCLEKGLPQATQYGITLYGRNGREGMEGDIKAFYAQRNKDVPNVLTSECVNPI